MILPLIAAVLSLSLTKFLSFDEYDGDYQQANLNYIILEVTRGRRSLRNFISAVLPFSDSILRRRYLRTDEYVEPLKYCQLEEVNNPNHYFIPFDYIKSITDYSILKHMIQNNLDRRCDLNELTINSIDTKVYSMTIGRGPGYKHYKYTQDSSIIDSRTILTTPRPLLTKSIRQQIQQSDTLRMNTYDITNISQWNDIDRFYIDPDNIWILTYFTLLFTMIGYILSLIVQLLNKYTRIQVQKIKDGVINYYEKSIIHSVNTHDYNKASYRIQQVLYFIQFCDPHNHMDYHTFQHMSAKCEIFNKNYVSAEQSLNSILRSYTYKQEDKSIYTAKVLEDLSYVLYCYEDRCRLAESYQYLIQALHIYEYHIESDIYHRIQLRDNVTTSEKLKIYRQFLLVSAKRQAKYYIKFKLFHHLKYIKNDVMNTSFCFNKYDILDNMDPSPYYDIHSQEQEQQKGVKNNTTKSTEKSIKSSTSTSIVLTPTKSTHRPNSTSQVIRSPMRPLPQHYHSHTIHKMNTNTTSDVSVILGQDLDLHVHDKSVYHTIDIARIYYHMGRILMENYQFKDALTLFNVSLHIYQELQDTSSTSLSTISSSSLLYKEEICIIQKQITFLNRILNYSHRTTTMDTTGGNNGVMKESKMMTNIAVTLKEEVEVGRKGQGMEYDKENTYIMNKNSREMKYESSILTKDVNESTLKGFTILSNKIYHNNMKTTKSDDIRINKNIYI